MTIVAKTVGEPMLWQSALWDVVKRADPDLPVARVRRWNEVIATSVAWRETPMRLLAGFALIGLLLASIGVYGVLAYYVSQRTREIGVRAALGATGRSSLARGQAIAGPIAAGVILGVAGSFASGRLLQRFSLPEWNPAIRRCSSGLLCCCSAAACSPAGCPPAEPLRSTRWLRSETNRFPRSEDRVKW